MVAWFTMPHSFLCILSGKFEPHRKKGNGEKSYSTTEKMYLPWLLSGFDRFSSPNRFEREQGRVKSVSLVFVVREAPILLPLNCERFLFHIFRERWSTLLSLFRHNIIKYNNNKWRKLKNIKKTVTNTTYTNSTRMITCTNWLTDPGDGSNRFASYL